MEPLRTVIFVDGRNFKYNLQAFRFQSTGTTSDRPYRLDEKHFRWREFFLGVLEKFNTATQVEHRLIRVYWYNAESIRPFEVNERQVQQLLTDHQSQYPELTPERVRELAKSWYDEERRYFDQTKERLFENIQRRVDFLEFKYVGEYVVRPFEAYRIGRQEDGSLFYQGTREGEKGVDVGIAVDMISKASDYDTAILVSGDADFLPVVRYLKDALRFVYQFSLARGIPPRINYLSPWLIGRVDTFQFYDELELLSTYLDRTSGIPPVILEAIDDRIHYLNDLSARQQRQ